MRLFESLFNKDRERISDGNEVSYGAMGTESVGPVQPISKKYNAIVTEVSKAIEAHGGHLQNATTQEDRAIINNQLLMLGECMKALRQKGGQESIDALKAAAKKDREFPSYFRNETGLFAGMAKKMGVQVDSGASAIVDRVITYLEADLKRVTSADDTSCGPSREYGISTPLLGKR